MKRVYLDQNKWVDLAGAAYGLAGGQRFEDAYLLLKAGVEAGDLSLPLSSAHYIETSVRRHWRSRRNLAVTMVALSQLHTIAPLQAVIPPEVDRALQRFSGRPPDPRPLQPFGVGASHAFNAPIPQEPPAEAMWQLGKRWGLKADINKLREIRLLVGPTPDEEREIPDYKPLSHLAVAEQYAKGKEELRETRQAEGWNKGDRARRVGHAQALADHLEVINDALARAGLGPDFITAGGEAGMTRFLKAVPTMWTSGELERLRHTASQRKWERQDLLDIAALSVASVYCDVVVTERQWVAAAERAGFPLTLGTVFLHRLDELPAHVV